MPTKKTIKVKKVTRKFMLDLANSIYNTKTKKFLLLCNGQLVNGPDPTDASRRMHCGLGELYFAMTGQHPKGVTEDGVVDLAIKNSPVAGAKKRELDAAKSFISKLNVSDYTKEDMLEIIESADRYDELGDPETKLKELLNSIPDKNDDSHSDEFCTAANFQERSKRVAAIFREAAAILPK